MISVFSSVSVTISLLLLLLLCITVLGFSCLFKFLIASYAFLSGFLLCLTISICSVRYSISICFLAFLSSLKILFLFVFNSFLLFSYVWAFMSYLSFCCFCDRSVIMGFSIGFLFVFLPASSIAVSIHVLVMVSHLSWLFLFVFFKLSIISFTFCLYLYFMSSSVVNILQLIFGVCFVLFGYILCNFILGISHITSLWSLLVLSPL